MEIEEGAEQHSSIVQRTAARTRPLRMRLAQSADRAERRYLTVLRYAMLAIATGAILIAAGLLAWGVIKQIGSSRVAPDNIAVSPDDVSPDRPAAADEARSADAQPKALALDKEIRDRTIAVYRSAFKPYERSGKPISDVELIALVWPQERLQQYAALSDPLLADLEQKPLGDSKAIGFEALTVVEKATGTNTFKQSLSAYRDARQTRVCTDQFRSRSRTVRTWDPYAMSCPGWYESPVGCASQQTVQEPYVENVCQMKFPENLDNPAQAFGAAVGRYADIARTKAAQSRIAAGEESARIMARKLSGRDNIFSSFWIFGGFLAIMLLYLLIAMERHHRLLRQLLPTPPRKPDA